VIFFTQQIVGCFLVRAYELELHLRLAIGIAGESAAVLFAKPLIGNDDCKLICSIGVTG
jgi:hypothetical protein